MVRFSTSEISRRDLERFVVERNVSVQRFGGGEIVRTASPGELLIRPLGVDEGQFRREVLEFGGAVGAGARVTPGPVEKPAPEPEAPPIKEEARSLIEKPGEQPRVVVQRVPTVREAIRIRAPLKEVGPRVVKAGGFSDVRGFVGVAEVITGKEEAIVITPTGEVAEGIVTTKTIQERVSEGATRQTLRAVPILGPLITAIDVIKGSDDIAFDIAADPVSTILQRSGIVDERLLEPQITKRELKKGIAAGAVQVIPGTIQLGAELIATPPELLPAKATQITQGIIQDAITDPVKFAGESIGAALILGPVGRFGVGRVGALRGSVGKPFGIGQKIKNVKFFELGESRRLPGGFVEVNSRAVLDSGDVLRVKSVFKPPKRIPKTGESPPVEVVSIIKSRSPKGEPTGEFVGISDVKLSKGRLVKETFLEKAKIVEVSKPGIVGKAEFSIQRVKGITPTQRTLLEKIDVDVVITPKRGVITIRGETITEPGVIVEDIIGRPTVGAARSFSRIQKNIGATLTRFEAAELATGRRIRGRGVSIVREAKPREPARIPPERPPSRFEFTKQPDIVAATNELSVKSVRTTAEATEGATSGAIAGLNRVITESIIEPEVGAVGLRLGASLSPAALAQEQRRLSSRLEQRRGLIPQQIQVLNPLQQVRQAQVNILESIPDVRSRLGLDRLQLRETQQIQRERLTQAQRTQQQRVTALTPPPIVSPPISPPIIVPLFIPSTDLLEDGRRRRKRIGIEIIENPIPNLLGFL